MCSAHHTEQEQHALGPACSEPLLGRQWQHCRGQTTVAAAIQPSQANQEFVLEAGNAANLARVEECQALRHTLCDRSSVHVPAHGARLAFLPSLLLAKVLREVAERQVLKYAQHLRGSW